MRDCLICGIYEHSTQRVDKFRRGRRIILKAAPKIVRINYKIGAHLLCNPDTRLTRVVPQRIGWHSYSLNSR